MAVTALTVTHDMSSVEQIADNVALLESGLIRWEGETKKLWETKNPYITQFINGETKGPISVI